ncbi:hypothetical protein HYW39_01350 [Candidatus Curtissbacteria bacterium]|nr:hypothetical protein [Candidatus Curtissbacteria bacterium]
METGEFQASPDINARIEDTIPVPLEPGEFLHVSTSRRQFGDFFKEYAYFLGFNGNEAKQFFDNNVNLTFSPIDHRELDLPLTDIERKFWMQVSRIKYGLMIWAVN